METQLVFPCGSRGNSDRALGLRVRETFETQSSAIGSIVLKVQGLLNTKTGMPYPPFQTTSETPAFRAGAPLLSYFQESAIPVQIRMPHHT
jgi:hypothetical protein